MTAALPVPAPPVEAALDPADLARAVAACLAVAPAAFGGVVLGAPAGPARDAWLELLRRLAGPELPWVRLPLGVTDDRLVGGLDLAATLSLGRPVLETGVLARAHGGILEVSMAERVAPATAGVLLGALDRHEVAVEREGFSTRYPTALGLVLLDEHEGEEPGPPAALLERTAFWLALDATLAPGALGTAPAELVADVAAARGHWPTVRVAEGQVRALVGTAGALGIGSLRAPLQAVRCAAVLAALDWRPEADDDDVALAARLVLAPRATRLPAPPPAQPPPDTPPESEAERPEEGDRQQDDRPLEDRVLDAAVAALPPGMLALLAGTAARRSAERGRRGRPQAVARTGRAIGQRQGDPRRHRLDVLATLRAAAPWQPLRGRPAGDPAARLRLRRDDFRVKRLKQKVGTTVVFAVDASGSAAAARLAEAKGAVELLLGESYARRDKVALVTFRGAAAEVAVPPTRSLTRAKRLLAGLPGGGGTPLATAIDRVHDLALQVRRGGGRPLAVFLTDGRANVARDGTGGRARAEQEASAAAQRLQADDVAVLFIDTSPRPNPAAATLAARMGAQYLPLPVADARAIGGLVRAGARGAR